MKILPNLTLFLFTTVAFCQVKADFKIYQYFGSDSINGHISKIVKYNSDGLIVFEELINFWHTRHSGLVDTRKTHYYRDTLRIKTLHEYSYPYLKEKDSVKFEYNYDDQNSLIQRVYYSKRTKTPASETNETINDSNTELKNSIWEIDAIHHFEYDKSGRKSKYYTSKDYPKSQFHYLYEYDDENRLTKETFLYYNNEIYWKKIYSYIDNGYDYIIVRDNEKAESNEVEETFIYKFRVEKDNFGNIVLETSSNKNQFIDYRIEREFDINNRLIVERRYNYEYELEITNIYYYE